MLSQRASDVFFGAREQGLDVRQSNATAIAAVANVVKSSLGPVGLDKVRKRERDGFFFLLESPRKSDRRLRAYTHHPPPSLFPRSASGLQRGVDLFLVPRVCVCCKSEGFFLSERSRDDSVRFVIVFFLSFCSIGLTYLLLTFSLSFYVCKNVNNRCWWMISAT